MKTLMALVLSLGMVLLGTAPVMAAGQLMAPKAAANLSAPVKALKPDPSLTQPAIPEPLGFRTMSDTTLNRVVGTENIMHAAMAEVFSNGDLEGGGGVGPLVVYAAGKAAQDVLTSRPALYIYAQEAYNAIRNWLLGDSGKDDHK